MHTPTLHRLLDVTARQAPEYRDGLSNHLPMALQALADLGADGRTLEQFTDAYLQRTGIQMLEAKAAPLNHWPAALGDMRAYDSLCATFDGSIRTIGMEATVRAALPHLWPGVAAAAFHGLIRLSHAWQAKHAGEVAAGLAYWAARWQPTGAPAVPRTMDMGQWLAHAEQVARQWRSDASLISLRMSEAAQSSTYLVAAPALCIPPDAIQRGTAWAAQRYTESKNFTVLHVVTGLYAVLVLSEIAPPPASVWNAVFAAIQSSQLAPTDSPAQSSLSWTAIKANARQSWDDHVIKLVHACSQLNAVQANEIYRFAAARATGA